MDEAEFFDHHREDPPRPTSLVRREGVAAVIGDVSGLDPARLAPDGRARRALRARPG